MRIQPNLYKVIISESASGYGQKTQDEFKKEQEKFLGLDFITLSDFDPDHKYTPQIITSGDFVLGDSDLLELAIRNIEFKVVQKVKVDVDISNQLAELAGKPCAISLTSGGETNYNTKCEVHIPNISMLMYNELMLKEDVCTDELQSELNSGWRIIAACPQPDQRRPDYILGRFNPEMSDITSAKR